MSMTDGISLFLGAISLFLGGCSIFQSQRYKKLGDKYNKYIETLMQNYNDIYVYSAIITRDIHEKISENSNLLNLHKDQLYVFKNPNYRINNASKIIDKLNTKLPDFLKQTYIDSILEKINLDDESDTEIGVVTLRHQCNKDDLESIKKLNDIFYDDGISFVIRIS